jgi:hypothetical protein
VPAGASDCNRQRPLTGSDALLSDYAAIVPPPTTRSPS